MPGIPITGTFIRGAGDAGQFAINIAANLQIPVQIVADIAARDALVEFLRMPYMLVYVISNTNTYRLGVDTDIPSQTWTLESADYILTTAKGAAGGVAPLDSNSKIPSQYLNQTLITNVHTAADLTAMFALTTFEGELIIVTDASADPAISSGSATYVKLNDNAPVTTLPDFSIIEFAVSVTSVNGETGVVSIDFDDILAWGSSSTQFAVAVAADASVTANAAATVTNAADIVTLGTDKANKSNVLELDNTDIFTPSADYHPATKKYVDDELAAFSGTTPGGNTTEIQVNVSDSFTGYSTFIYASNLLTVDNINISASPTLDNNLTSLLMRKGDGSIQYREVSSLPSTAAWPLTGTGTLLGAMTIEQDNFDFRIRTRTASPPTLQHGLQVTTSGATLFSNATTRSTYYIESNAGGISIGTLLNLASPGANTKMMTWDSTFKQVKYMNPTDMPYWNVGAATTLATGADIIISQGTLSSTNYSSITFDDGDRSIVLYATDDVFSVFANLTIARTGVTTDKPFNYTTDISGNYTDRSLIDKGFADASYWAVTGTSILTGATTIEGDGNPLYLGTTASRTQRVEIVTGSSGFFVKSESAVTSSNVQSAWYIVESTGTVAAGFGMEFNYNADNSVGATETIGRIHYNWLDPLAAQLESEYTIKGQSEASIIDFSNLTAARLLLKGGLQVSNNTTQTIKTVHIQLTESEVRALNTTAITLIPAPSAGEFIQFISGAAFIDVSTAFVTGSFIQLQFTGGSAIYQTVAAFINSATDKSTTIAAMAVDGDLTPIATALEITADVDSTVGTGSTIDVYVQYVIITTV